MHTRGLFIDLLSRHRIVFLSCHHTHCFFLCCFFGTVEAGDRIAQLVLERISTPDVVVVESLDATERGAGGFGSTGTGRPGATT